jgi:hypothetical protein
MAATGGDALSVWRTYPVSLMLSLSKHESRIACFDKLSMRLDCSDLRYRSASRMLT